MQTFYSKNIYLYNQAEWEKRFLNSCPYNINDSPLCSGEHCDKILLQIFIHRRRKSSFQFSHYLWIQAAGHTQYVIFSLSKSLLYSYLFGNY